ncbi:TPA: hypothetical protein HA242_06120 [Candidatus Woesearchaeota archaeon]|nr:hypothetical protein [Candidatus Woesearchaeota archaeon]HIH13272.1 hypothetical protein [Candidatus Woesearchaeota archaeon]
MNQKRRLKKKGILYTLSLTLLSLTLLSLAAVFMFQSRSVELRYIDLSFAQKVSDLDQSMKSILSEAFLKKTNLNFSVDGNSMNIKETMPRDLAGMDTLMQTIKDQGERDFPILTLDLASFQDRHGLILQPQNINYVQQDSNDIIVDPNDNLLSYNINLSFTKNIISCEILDSDQGNLKVDVAITSPENSCGFSRDDVKFLIINIDLGGEKPFLSIIDKGGLHLWSTAAVNSSISIGMLPGVQEKHLEIPLTVIINDTMQGFYKESGVKLLLLSNN